MATQIIDLSCTDFQQLQSENQQLRQALAETRRQVIQLSRCRTFQILNAEGLQMAWEEIAPGFPAYALLYFDIDRLKQLNRDLGITAVNQRIYNAFNCVRSSEIIGRGFNGDEFVCICALAHAGMIHQRIVRGFAEQGISITTAMAQATSINLAAALRPLIAEVERKKRERDAVTMLPAVG